MSRLEGVYILHHTERWEMVDLPSILLWQYPTRLHDSDFR